MTTRARQASFPFSPIFSQSSQSHHVDFAVRGVTRPNGALCGPPSYPPSLDRRFHNPLCARFLHLSHCQETATGMVQLGATPFRVGRQIVAGLTGQRVTL
jgi:hypothetical protein